MVPDDLYNGNPGENTVPPLSPAESHEESGDSPGSSPSSLETGGFSLDGPPVASELPPTRRVGPALAIAAILVPVVATCMQFCDFAVPYALAIGIGSMVLSSVLIAIDAFLLEHCHLRARERGSEGFLLLGLLLLWIVVFPYALFRRRRYEGPNLGFVAILVALFAVFGPLVNASIQSTVLPRCTSPKVVELLANIIRKSPAGSDVISIDGHREVEYDRTVPRREGRCMVHRAKADFEVTYFVEWQNRDTHRFQVRVPGVNLPRCTSIEVIRLLEQVIRRSPAGPKVIAIDGHQEIDCDQQASVRKGRCVLHGKGEDCAIFYVVEWSNRDKGMFRVRLVAE
jgi:hypothetical protein